MTYTVKQFDRNSYRADKDGNFVEAIELWECGHKHRTLKGAVRCLESLEGTTRSIGAMIVDSDGDEADWQAVARESAKLHGYC